MTTKLFRQIEITTNFVAIVSLLWMMMLTTTTVDAWVIMIPNSNNSNNNNNNRCSSATKSTTTGCYYSYYHQLQKPICFSHDMILSMSSRTDTTTDNNNNENENDIDLLEMDVVIFSEKKNKNDDDSTTSNSKKKIGAVQENGNIALLSVWSDEPVYDESLEFVVDEHDLIPGYKRTDIIIHTLIPENKLSYGSRQVGGGKGPGNPHGEESEILYYIDQSIILNNDIELIIKPELEILW